MQNKQNEKGFTIIEVVLVLAIAALIFLIVFLALPALQRGQRDSQRKSDLGRIMSLLTTYASNSNGMYPGNDGAVAAFNSQYISSSNELKDPTTGETYAFMWGDLQPYELGAVFYNVKSRCVDGGIDVNPSGANLGLNDVAVSIKLEAGASYCIEN